MERTIHQDARPFKRLFGLYLPMPAIGVVAALMVFVYWRGQKNIRLLLQGGAVLSLVMMMWVGLAAFLMRPDAQWTVNDDGLIRTKPGGKPQLIRWHQIYRMKYTGLLLAIRWKDDPTKAAKHPAVGVQHRGFLYIANKEADELILGWRRHLPPEM